MPYDSRIAPSDSYNLADRHPDERQCSLGLIEGWERDFCANPAAPSPDSRLVFWGVLG